MIVIVKADELWDELNASLQRGVPDLLSLQRNYSTLLKFMSVASVLFIEAEENLISVFDRVRFEKQTRDLILKGFHFNERVLMKQINCSEEERKNLVLRDLLKLKMEFCQNYLKIMREKLELFKLENQLSGGFNEM